MPSRKEKNERLAHQALASIFEGSKVEGRIPNIIKVPSNHPASGPERGQPPRKTGLQILLPRGGFTHPEDGRYLMMPKEFKAILALETKAVAQVVYEVIDQTIGWEDPNGRGGRRVWARLSLRHFTNVCGMSLSQVQKGLKTALNNGYMIRRPHQGEYEYSINWRETEA